MHGTEWGRPFFIRQRPPGCIPRPPAGSSPGRCGHGPAPVEVTTDQARPYVRVVDELAPTAAHVTEQYSNNSVEADHARLKARLRPMRGLKRFRSAERLAAGHAFVQNIRRGHYELVTDVSPPLRLAEAFNELALAM